MKKLIFHIASAIVDHPDKIKVSEDSPKNSNLKQIVLSCDPSDMGRIIGKRGRIIRAIRDLLRIKSIIMNQKSILNLKEE